MHGERSVGTRAFVTTFLSLMVLVAYMPVIGQTPTGETQEGRYKRYGLFGGAMLSLHNADFTKMSDSGFCCPGTFGPRSSTGFHAGVLTEMPIGSSLILAGRLSGWMQSASYEQTQTTVFNNPVNNAPETGTFSYIVEPSLVSISLDALAQIRIAESLSLYAGPKIDYMLRGTFNQREEVTTPGYVFVDNLKKVRNVQTDAVIPALTSVHANLTFGIGYEIALNARRSTFLVPEVFGTYGLGSLSSGLRGAGQSWTMNSIVMNLALKFSPVSEPIEQEVRIISAPCDECKQRRTPESECLPVKSCPENRVLRMNKKTGECECALVEDVARIDKITGTSGAKTVELGIHAEPMIVEGFGRKTYKPLLPYVFFKESKDEYAVTYASVNSVQAANAELERAKTGTNVADALYKNVLNVIGLRMVANPKAVLRLRGTTDGIEKDSNGTLSLRRVNSIRKRFVQVFGIDASRLQIDSSRRGLPEKRAMVNGRTDHPFARAENRRVELYSDDISILAPVEVDDEIVVLSPDFIDYKIRVSTRNEPKQVALRLKGTTDAGADVTLGNETADLTRNSPEYVTLRFATKAFEPKAKSLKSVFIDPDQSKIYTSEQPVGYSNVDDALIPVKYVSASRKAEASMQDTVYRSYELNLFDFDSDQLSPMNKHIIDLARKEIGSESIVTVYGNTDNSGTPEINRSLSERRARSVASALSGAASVRTVGNADTQPMPGVSNDTPYGRNMNRNVVIVIANPINR